MSDLPKLALTMGDPAGIGPEIAVKAATDPRLAETAEIILYGCADILSAANERFGNSGMLKIKETGTMLWKELTVGKADAECGIVARNAVIEATKDALAGKVDAIVTAPMNKASVNLAGIPFTGHTELIAELCGVKDFAMMQSADNLRVVFVTTHISLSKVPEAVTVERITKVAELLKESIIQEGINSPKIAVAALNPHAGEDGYMGIEDEKIVKPAIAELRKKGVDIEGPFPPDTLFIASTLSQFDGIVSMYHDQGHIPFKMLAFDRGVNSTLGLPIIRTSVDHGTAFGIAWQGQADTGSLYAAIRLAATKARKN
jgi:4-hydroxythreonine-4-phosphate dehydrogenase